MEQWEQDLRVFWNSLDALHRLFGEEVAFDLLRRLQDAAPRAWWAGDIGDPTAPLYVRFSAERRFAEAVALHDSLTRQGRRLWPEEQDGFRAAAIERGVPAITIVTLPKSGSVYLARTIQQMLRVPVVRTSLSRFPQDHVLPEALGVFAQGGCLSQSHLDASPENLDRLAAAGITTLHVHVRDPRQATVSWAAHLRTNLVGAQSYLRHLSDPLPPAGFDLWPEADRLEWVAAHHFPACLRWLVQWIAVAENDSRFRIGFTEHQQLREDPLDAIREVLALFGADPTTIGADFIPSPQKGVAHYRQGGNEEWRDVLPPPIQDWMSRMIPAALCDRFGWART